jgi:hypothetical protein
MPPLISRRREGRAGFLTKGKSWNFTYMIDGEDEETRLLVNHGYYVNALFPV